MELLWWAKFVMVYLLLSCTGFVSVSGWDQCCNCQQQCAANSKKYQQQLESEWPPPILPPSTTEPPPRKAKKKPKKQHKVVQIDLQSEAALKALRKKILLSLQFFEELVCLKYNMHPSAYCNDHLVQDVNSIHTELYALSAHIHSSYYMPLSNTVSNFTVIQTAPTGLPVECGWLCDAEASCLAFDWHWQLGCTLYEWHRDTVRCPSNGLLQQYFDLDVTHFVK